MDAYRFKDSIIFQSTKFIYEVELFHSTKDSWNLEDSKLFGSKEFIEDLAECVIYPYINYRLIKYTNLIAAPKEWLKENANWFNYESKKEIKKKLKQEKENEKVV